DAFKRAVGTDAGKSAAALEEIAQLAVDGGTDTHFLIDSALDGLQAHARATRPTLRELDQVHDLRSAGGSRTAQRSHTGPTKNLWGVECPLFEQLTQAADVPPEKYTDTSLATFQVNVSKLVAGLFGRDSGPVIALGDPGCGKTRVPEWLATELGYPYGRFQALPDADRNDFLGTWRLKTGGPAFDKHEFIRLWQEGGIILIDEFNHFDEDMQRFIAEFVRNYHKEGFELTIGNERVKVQRNPQTRIVFTGNFDSPECNDIEDELASHCNIAWFAPMTGEDLTTLLQNWLPTYDPELVSLAGTFHADVVAKSINRELRGNHSLSIRNVEKLKERVTLYTDQDPNFAIARAVREVYLDHVDHPDDRAKLEEAFEAVFQIAPNDTIPDDSFYTLEVGDSAIRFGDVTFPVGPGGAKSIEGMTLDVGGIEDWPILADLDLKKAVYAILKAWSVNETPHLVGPDESDKNIAIRVAAEMTGWTPVEKGFNSQTQ
ncbi:MAG: AAA family ATPase, partial [Myxococcota bacterium]